MCLLVLWSSSLPAGCVCGSDMGRFGGKKATWCSAVVDEVLAVVSPAYMTVSQQNLGIVCLKILFKDLLPVFKNE